MFQHHLLLIYRNFKKYKSSFFINLIGLSAGLCCTLLIYFWVNDELHVDQFHAKNEQLYQLMEHETTGQHITTSDRTSAILGDALLAEMPEVENAASASPTFWLANTKLSAADNNELRAAGKFAGKEFFKVFSYPLLSGNPNRLFAGVESIVISAGMAKKLFHNTEVLGKEIVMKNVELKQEFHLMISGVFADIGTNSSDHFDFLLPMELLYKTAPNFLKWGNIGPSTFVVLKKGADPLLFNRKLKNYMKEKGESYRQLFSVRYAHNYLHGKYEEGKETGGRIEYVQLFSLIAIFILVIACINFMNLTTAKASRRMKEIGIKKVMGAGRSSLIFQYLVESLLLSFLAMFIALLGAELLLPAFNSLTSKNLSLDFSPQFLLVLLGIVMLTGLIAGSYPALYLSSFHPAAALKGRFSNSVTALWTRKGLVVFQFTLSVILIVAVFVVYKQIEFVQHNSSLGYNKDHVIYFEIEGKVKENINPFLAEVKQIPGVVDASSINRDFLGDLNSTVGDFSWEGRNPGEVIKFQHASVNSRLIETMDMKMASGRSFSTAFGSDSSKIIINEAGIRVMHLKDPVGKIFSLWGKNYEIIGVLKDFHFESFHETVKPMFLRFEAAKTNRVMVRLEGGKEKETIAGLQQFYARYNAGHTMAYRFLDEDYQAQYVAEHRVSVLSRYFAGLAIMISCLGLFGLAAFTAERRMKEIGIRKVLGASGYNIIYFLSKDFMRPVLISILIALPLSYVISVYWLNTFAYRIALQPWYFLGAGLLALLISWLTVGLQAFKAASVDPVQCLKTE